MHIHQLDTWRHGHSFLDLKVSRDNERRTFYVVMLTAVMMVVEIAAGGIFNSMALLADGWHMATHTGALGIAVFAYRYARRHMADRRFTFGVGKVEILGGFTSAVVLGVVALLMAWESATRLLNPLSISFDEAMIVAVLGLIVNLVSAWLLHDHDHARHRNGEYQDHNLRAAYLHVLADALTSVLAIVALFCGKIFGWIWMDAVVGIVGAVVIGRWAIVLLRDTGRILLDSEIGKEKSEEIRRSIEGDSDNRIVDLHIWWIGPQHLGAIVSLVTHYPKLPDHYKALLGHMGDLAHVTIEVNVCDGEPCLPTNKG